MLTRRTFMSASAGTAAALTAAGPAFARGLVFPQVERELMVRARAALAAKRRLVRNQEAMVVVDFSRPSREERLYLVDLASGSVTAYHVAHGRGSDPQHTGLLQRFSNEPGSEASSAGAYVLRDAYEGRNGRSVRLEGLDPTNSNAMARSIVIHAADYAEPETLARLGKLGRSEGCFAVAHRTLAVLMDQLAPGCLLYCNKI
jgi:hypothetical protein